MMKIIQKILDLISYPPMNLPAVGEKVEYLTTERYNGKPVYKGIVRWGYTGLGEYSKPHNIGMETALSIDVINNNSECITNGGNVEYVSINASAIVIKTLVNHGDLYFLIKYTKPG